MSSATSKRSPSQSKDVTTSSTTSSTTTVTTSATGVGQAPPHNHGKTPIGQSLRESFVNIMSSKSNTSVTNGGGRSPASPSRTSRLQEKEEMQNLNERLVVYIDTVRRLESENNRLQHTIQQYTENSVRDVADIKKLYETELEDAKRLIDELAKEKARIEIELNKHKADAEEALGKLGRRDRELRGLEEKYKAVESESLEYKKRYESVQNDHQRSKDEIAHLKPYSADLEKQLAKLKKQLEDETLARVDLENKNQTLKEDLQFKANLYEKETHQLRSSKRTEIEQVDVRLRDEYDSRLVNELQRIREDAEIKINEMKEEVERRFTNKLAEAESQLKRQATTASTLRDEATTYRSRTEELQSEVRSLQAKLATHETRQRELEDRINANNGKHARDIADREAEIQRLNKELNELLLEYQELHDIKIALDMEISAYRKLLESEEQRLNISHQHSQLGSSFLADQSGTTNGSSAARGSKKRRLTAALDFDESTIGSVSTVTSSSTSSAQYTQSHTSSSGIEIVEHDFEGRQIRLLNTNDKDVAIGGWLLRRNADDQLVEYKFGAKVVLKPGQQITVWSSNAAGVTHDAARGDFVMSDKRWQAGDSMITSLVDKEGTEQARRESRRNPIVVEKKLRNTPIKSSLSSSNVSTTTGEKKSGFFGLW